LPFTKERNRENEKDPGKWTQNRIGKKSQAVPLDQISSKPNFEILQDEGLVTPSKSNHHGTVLIFLKIFRFLQSKNFPEVPFFTILLNNLAHYSIGMLIQRLRK
jgi:hypothetical protein